jgi:hypothetical protein
MKPYEPTTALPSWQRPFENEDFRGYFTWGSDLTARIGGSIYHACHEDEARMAFVEGQLGLRSTYSITHPSYGLCSAPCVWCGLNYFNNGNQYGPVLLKFPLKRLDGRTFMVFWRNVNRHRFFFVQYEAHIPVFVREGKPDRRVDPAHYFRNQGKSLWLKDRAIYDVVLTQAVGMVGIQVEGTRHPACIPKKCRGLELTRAQAVVAKLGRTAVDAHLRSDLQLRRLLRRFPLLQGTEVRLPRL